MEARARSSTARTAPPVTTGPTAISRAGRARSGHSAPRAPADDATRPPRGQAGPSSLARAVSPAFSGTMTASVVILGGGTGGTLTANRLRRRFDQDDMTITVVDRDDRHVYQPGLLFVPFGLSQVEDIVRSRRRQLRR